ncbi:maleylpyruvate isomerase family mycothiol-dependent enzyme [Planobispora siamensis]|uniref:Mycothiol-dependent maleylpyruvate isomerase metal-binding domain-containing protein n=1 Tax=Planobispora siamensis TaxID=936338 RepID=A0A8J3WSG5_9ACTN|nr:maleylpyruvate isomerase family mycothiol-dependent enzyme [Planobispora siamensis]GIH97891.1 hypothetical protein Psi01_85210 [Planobispora siamensis]
MNQQEIWAALEIERRGLADMLDGLSPEDWDRPSLCEGWRVREVAAHLAMSVEVKVGRVLVEFVRARGSFNRVVRDTAVRHARRQSTGDIVEEIRKTAVSHSRAFGTKPLDPLFDALVHGQDIAVPLRIGRTMPLEAARVCATHIWERGFLFHPQRRLRGLRLVATDTDWAVGEGEVVQGPVQALLLLMSGRSTAALPDLDGAGMPAPSSRIS